MTDSAKSDIFLISQTAEVWKWKEKHYYLTCLPCWLHLRYR